MPRILTGPCPDCGQPCGPNPAKDCQIAASITGSSAGGRILTISIRCANRPCPSGRKERAAETARVARSLLRLLEPLQLEAIGRGEA